MSATAGVISSRFKVLSVISIKSVDDLVNMLNVKDLFRTVGPAHPHTVILIGSLGRRGDL
ncbi:hypothetical protein ANCDUO_10968 [Ancylostoma duodenale]|uniref:Uncharacterized protein n=1 Tax=Ancylostoma duodenale TaxID=51022 RepID=A0A0C2GP97_9BILA|nr:hypothetical protein ANCDUO_10968 [Ancylostoma duodenale]